MKTFGKDNPIGKGLKTFLFLARVPPKAGVRRLWFATRPAELRITMGTSPYHVHQNAIWYDSSPYQFQRGKSLLEIRLKSTSRIQPE
jgi:hypothetical protein